MNFQDVIRESYDASNLALKVNVVAGGTGQATVNINGSATIFAVVNTSAVGVQNSIVTIANTPLDTQIVGNVTLSDSKGFIGLTTNVIGSAPTLFAVVNTSAPGITNSIVTVANTVPVTFSGNVTLDDGSLTGIVGNITIDSGTISVDSLPAIPAGLNNIGFATVAVSTPTLYAVVNTGAAGITNSIVTVAGGQLYGNVTLDSGSLTGIRGNITIDSMPDVTVGTNVAWPDPHTFIGLVTVTLSGGSAESNIGDVSVSGIKGNITIDSGNISIKGNVTLSGSLPAGVNSIGFASVTPVSAWPDPKTYIGLVTVANTVAVTQSGTWDEVGINDSGNSITVDGTVALGAGVAGIGFATVNVAAIAAGDNNIGNVDIASIAAGDNNIGNVDIASIAAGNNNIGDVDAIQSGTWTVQPGNTANTTPWLTTNKGNITLDVGSLVGIRGNLTLSNPNTFIGLTTTVNGAGTRFIGLVTAWVSGIAGNVTLSDSKGFIGLNTVVNGAGDRFIGLVTAWARNAGTTKTLVQLPVGLGNNSLTTVAVPTNAQKISATQLILNSNVTTEIAIKSGVTYLTGNATLGVTIFPGGGFVMNGSPDSPVWISLPSGAMVVEKRDPGGTVSKIAGHVIYFDE